jgi:hypothetical protein
MDIEILNSGTVQSKNWLNPVCRDIECNDINSDSINCNELIANVIFGDTKAPVLPLSTKLFSLLTSLGVNQPLITTTAPANIAYINNPSISLGNNTYTATTDQYIQITVSYTLVAPIGGITAINKCSVLLNGGLTPIFCTCYPNVATDEPISLICSGVLRLLAGEVVSVSFVNTGFAPGWRYTAFAFSGVVI